MALFDVSSASTENLAGLNLSVVMHYGSLEELGCLSRYTFPCAVLSQWC